MRWIKGLLINFQFFSAIPVPFTLPMDEQHLEKAVKTMPLLGLIQGGIYSLALYTLVHWTPFSDLAAAIAILFLGFIITGGIHLDGWMDASDAFFSYRDKKKRLDIMDDPHIGAFGVMSVIMLLGTRFLFTYEVIQMIEPVTYFFIALVPFFSKWVMGVLLVFVKPAKNKGLGSLFQQACSYKTLFVYPIYLFGVFIIMLLIKLPVEGFIALILVTGGIIFYLVQKIPRWFGGTTGDVIGASGEGTEVILWMTLWLFHYFAMA